MSKKKLIAALLASACVTAGAFGFAACGNDDDKPADNGNPQIVAVYNLYADNARANGETVLSYTDWLASITGDKGDKGDKADKCEKGQKGDNRDKGQQREQADYG